MNEFEKMCSRCENNYIFNKLYEIIGEDFGLCTKCLEEKMKNGEIKPFTEEQLNRITDALKDRKIVVNDTHKDKNYRDDYQKEPKMEFEFVAETKPSDGSKNMLDKNLNLLAKQGKLNPVVGRRKEIDQIMMILTRKFKSNPLLVGDPGVGKTAIVEGIAQKIVKGTVPDHLKNKEIYEINVGDLVAGTKYRGDFEAKLKKLIEEIKKRKNVILFIDEFHSIMNAGGAEGSVNAVSILKPYIARSEIQIIGATTYDEYQKHIMEDGAFSRRMQTVHIKEPSPEETFEIIKGLKETLEKHHRIIIPDDIINHCIKMSNRYLSEKFQPDKTIDLLDEAAAFKTVEEKEGWKEIEELEKKKQKIIQAKDRYIIEDNFEEAKRQLDLEQKIKEEIKKKKEEIKKLEKQDSYITKNDINKLLEKRTGIPVSQLTDDDTVKIKELETRLKKRIKGQDKAVKEVTRFVKRSKLNLKDPKRPNGVFLFLGQTGVGKTELAKSLAIELFGSEKAMIRLDMSEFMEKNAANKLIGSPPGYVGYEEGGKLTNQLRREPYSIVLFDEVEKAHPEVLNVMLQLFEDGIITDNKGKTVDARNAIFIMTSNAGTEELKYKNVGFDVSISEEEKHKSIEQKVMDAIKTKNYFKPELLNRIDSIVVFNELSEQAIWEILEKLTEEFKERMEKEGYYITFSESAKQLLKKEGYKPEFGARELKRKVENIADLLADAILETSSKHFKVIEKEGKLSIEAVK